MRSWSHGRPDTAHDSGWVPGVGHSRLAATSRAKSPGAMPAPENPSPKSVWSLATDDPQSRWIASPAAQTVGSQEKASHASAMRSRQVRETAQTSLIKATTADLKSSGSPPQPFLISAIRSRSFGVRLRTRAGQGI